MGRLHPTNGRHNMRNSSLKLSLCIDSPLISRESLNFSPTEWPPNRSTPVVIGHKGEIISRFDDHFWDLSIWAGKSMKINFGDGPQRKGCPPISTDNADTLRLFAGWMLWGPRGVRSPGTLSSKIKLLRPFFIISSRENIRVEALGRHPKLIDELCIQLKPKSLPETIRMLTALYEQRKQIGGYILEPAEIKRLTAIRTEDSRRQTPYIPPRIWKYQLNRLREVLEEYIDFKDKIEQCHEFCLDAYIKNYGSIDSAYSPSRNYDIAPFGDPPNTAEHTRLLEFHGSFHNTAARFGIDKLLCKYRKISESSIPIYALSQYMRMITEAGCAYVINLSLMRIEEAWRLKLNCLKTESDTTLGTIYMLEAPTTKTIDDDRAVWVTSSEVSLAIDAMASIAAMRRSAMPSFSNNQPRRSHHDFYLAPPVWAPWVSVGRISLQSEKRQAYTSYRRLVEENPRLFDAKELTITEEDLYFALRLNPDLDTKLFKVGSVWPLAWHQLRRTGTVNMQASGIVSEASLQYQLKHLSRAMTMYYGRGSAYVNLDEGTRTEYLKAMFEVQGKKIDKLFNDSFVSPYGAQRKAEILRPVNGITANELSTAAKEGRVSWRETLLGGCTKRGPCEYGGIDNIIRCGGGDGKSPCADALYDRDKKQRVIKLSNAISERLRHATEGTPHYASLIAQRSAVQKVLNVIS